MSSLLNRQRVQNINQNKDCGMSLKKSNEESRKFQRLSKEVEVELSELTYPLKKEATAVARIKDISPKGICISSATLFKPKTVVTATIHLAGWQRHKKNLSFMLDDAAIGKPLTVIAEVVWSKKEEQSAGYEIGVKFLDINEDDYQALKKFMAI